MDIVLTILLLPIVMLIGVIVLSKGECYYCGYKFTDSDIVMQMDGKKCCNECIIKSIRGGK